VSVLIRAPVLEFKKLGCLDPSSTDDFFSNHDLRSFYAILEETRALLAKKSGDPHGYRKRGTSTRFWNRECAIYPVVVPAPIGENTVSLFKLIYFLGCIQGVHFSDCVSSQIPICFLDESIDSSSNLSRKPTARFVFVTRSLFSLDDVAKAAERVLRWNARSIEAALYV
jgi:hypothetical protein